MKMVKDILVPVNLIPLSPSAIAGLKLLQETFESHIELLHVVPNSPFYVENEALLKEAIQLRLQHIRDSLSDAGVHVSDVTVQHGSAYERVIEYAHETEKNLIFVDRENLKEKDVDVTIDKIVRKSLNPVWVVNSDRQSDGSVEKILCAYDLSDNSARIVKNAIVLAKAFHSELHLLHVVEQTTYDWWTGVSGEAFEAYAQKEIESAEAFLDQFSFADVNIVKIFLRGRPYEEILLQVAETEPDLVIIGTRGQSNLKTLLIGSVSEHVLAQLTTSFLTMKEQSVFELPDKAFIENQLGRDELLKRARRLRDAGFPEEAIYYLKTYLRLNDRELTVYNEMAACYRDLQDNEAADKYLAQAKQIEKRLWELKVQSEMIARRHN